MEEKKFDLEDRLVCFAVNVISLVKTLPNDKIGDYYGKKNVSQDNRFSARFITVFIAGFIAGFIAESR